MIFCGLGGQGILFMTKIFARAALDKGLPTLGAETHGMAQRGGSVVSHLKLGPASSSLVREQTARFLLALEENEAYRNLPFLAPGGTIYVNAETDAFPRKEALALYGKTGNHLPCVSRTEDGHGTQKSHVHQSGVDGILCSLRK